MATINLTNHLDNEPLVRSLGSQNANLIKEQNNYSSYEWMKNKHGRLVPIALPLIEDKLRRGFIRTDGVVHTDDLSNRVQPVQMETNPAKAMAMIAEQLVESTKAQNEMVKELVKGRKKKSISKQEIAEESDEN